MDGSSSAIRTLATATSRPTSCRTRARTATMTQNRTKSQPHSGRWETVPAPVIATRSTATNRRRCRLPAVVGEGLVGLRHAVDVVLALVGAALLVHRVEQLVGEALGHRLLAALARELHEPADGEGLGAPLGHLDRDLVGGAADTPRANLEHGGERLDGVLERLDRVLAGPLAEDGEGVVDDPLGVALLPVEHHLVDDLLDHARAVDRIRLDGPDRRL